MIENKRFKINQVLFYLQELDQVILQPHPIPILQLNVLGPWYTPLDTHTFKYLSTTNHVFPLLCFICLTFFFTGEIRTSVKAGTKFNVTWHLGYPHQGGFRLELLDANEKFIQELTQAGDGKFVLGDTT